MPSPAVYTLSLHDALPIFCAGSGSLATQQGRWAAVYRYNHSDSYVSLVLSLADSYAAGTAAPFPTRPPGTTLPPANEPPATPPDRKSTRLNSSHSQISYAVPRGLHSFPTRRSSDLLRR